MNKKNVFIKKAIDNYFLNLKENDYNQDDLIEIINHLSRIYDRIA
ncbi:hypothetical protein [Peribacillus muralis]